MCALTEGQYRLLRETIESTVLGGDWRSHHESFASACIWLDPLLDSDRLGFLFFFNLYILYVELIEFVTVNMCVRTHQSDMHILTCMQ